jgi:glycosyltransferase involved in cell wall biosynthesis
MYRDRFVAVVIPAHNEERHVGAVIEHIPSFVDVVIVVDDASTDGTADAVIASSRSNVLLIRRPRNGGMGSAIVDGFRAALDKGADLVAVLDADGQMDSGQLSRLLDPIADGETDFAKGNRFFSRRSFDEMPAYRVLGNLVLTFFTKAATGYWHMFDSENGYTAISGRMLRTLPLHRLETGYQFPNRLLVELSTAGARILDVPMPARYGEEVSGIRPVRDGLAILRALFTGFWGRAAREYFRRPSLPGAFLALSLVGLIGGVASLFGMLWDLETAWLGGAVAVAFTLGLGSLALFFALDAARKRGRVRPSPAEGPEIVSLDLSSGANQRREDERELAHREHP